MSATRESVIAEARTWIGTPYHLGARVKGAGVDCGTFIAEVLISQGLAQREDLGVFSHDWFQHTDIEKYKFHILRHANKTMEGISYKSLQAEPGNIVLTKVAHSGVLNHGGIITRWPMVVHAISPKVEEINAATHPMWAFRTVVIFDPFHKDESRQSE